MYKKEFLPILSAESPEGEDEQKQMHEEEQGVQEATVLENEVKPDLKEVFRTLLVERGDEIKEFVARYSLFSSRSFSPY